MLRVFVLALALCTVFSGTAFAAPYVDSAQFPYWVVYEDDNYQYHMVWDDVPFVYDSKRGYFYPTVSDNDYLNLHRWSTDRWILDDPDSAYYTFVRKSRVASTNFNVSEVQDGVSTGNVFFVAGNSPCQTYCQSVSEVLTPPPPAQPVEEDDSAWWDSLFDDLADMGRLLQELANLSNELWRSITSVIAYLNPLSQDFFLKTAFVPSDGYFQRKSTEVKALLDDRFPIIQQAKDTWSAIQSSSYIESEWAGIQMKIPLTGQTLTVISPVFVNEVAPKVKFWFTGIIWLYMLLHTFKIVSSMINR